eukprot:TRINITY_DN1249_c0_g1_i2.p1 TRINITY_DN1249_c0_g1~~TRINITY_DN1249_c0_g1_i2.p1  ORF type:complete len:251 (-),score=30.28 TRINITY_DN1249_c0_g1_i2:115-867(-)
MKKIGHFLVLLCIGISSVACQCGNYTASDGSLYQLDALTLTNTDYVGSQPYYTYYWNFCYNLVSNTCGPPSAATQISETGVCVSNGYLSGYKLSDHPSGPDQGFQLSYINTQDSICKRDIDRQTNIIVTCDPSSATKLTSLEETSLCVYEINMVSKYACPVPKVFASLDYILPTSGPLSGRTKVFFVGSNFNSNTTCRFGPISGVNPTFESEQVLFCTSPSSPFQGTAQVTVSNDGKNWSTNDVTFTWSD